MEINLSLSDYYYLVLLEGSGDLLLFNVLNCFQYSKQGMLMF